MYEDEVMHHRREERLNFINFINFLFMLHSIIFPRYSLRMSNIQIQSGSLDKNEILHPQFVNIFFIICTKIKDFLSRQIFS